MAEMNGQSNGQKIKIMPDGIRITIAWHYLFIFLTGIGSALGGNWYYNAPSRQEFNNRHQIVAEKFETEERAISDLKQQVTECNTKYDRAEQEVQLLEREIDRIIPPAKNKTYRLVPEGKIEMPGPNAGIGVSGPPPVPEDKP